MKYSDRQKYVMNSAAIHKYLFLKRIAMNIEWHANPKKKTGEKPHLKAKKKGTKHKSSLSTKILGLANLQLRIDIIGIMRSQETKTI
jgi:hypothetical protein